MNTDRQDLLAALRGIVDAYDALPENRRCTRHFPKSVAEAVETGRLSMFSISDPIRDTVSALSADKRGRLEAHALGLINHSGKRRIYLRGGPLDGCWYLIKAGYTGDGILFRWQRPNEVAGCVVYSLPDNEGNCRYME